MRAGIGESDNVIVVGTPPLKTKAENPKSAISMEMYLLFYERAFLYSIF